MDNFLRELKEEIKDNCKHCNQIEDKISELNILNLTPDILFCADYLYHPKKNSFERGSYGTIIIPQINRIGNLKCDLDHYNKTFGGSRQTKDTFISFIMHHIMVFQMQKTIMPTFMIIYDDNTFSMMSFTFSIRTTIYRKVNELAKRIKTDGIVQIYYVGETYQYSDKDLSTFLLMPYEERILHCTKETLLFCKFGYDIDALTCQFDSAKINDMSYVSKTISEISKNKTDMHFNFYAPIINAFK